MIIITMFGWQVFHVARLQKRTGNGLRYFTSAGVWLEFASNTIMFVCIILWWDRVYLQARAWRVKSIVALALLQLAFAIMVVCIILRWDRVYLQARGCCDASQLFRACAALNAAVLLLRVLCTTVLCPLRGLVFAPSSIPAD